MKNKILKKYIKLLIKAENATRRDEANFIIKKANKLQTKLSLSF